MSNCSNCYNGCPEVISDQCVKYTGVDVPLLGIQKGDSLSYVEQAIITFLTSTLDGTGIKVNIDPTILCPIVNEYLVDCEDLNVDNLFETIIKVVCDLQVQIDGLDSAVVSIQNTLNTLNADYDKKCLSGVTNSSDTHAIVQAIIDKLCQFIIDVDLTYVKIADIDTYIQNYLNSIGTDSYYSKMVPFVAYEYYGPIGPTPGDPSSGFDITGAGYGKWEKVYLCNGANSTPDRRGRVAVGVTTGMNGAVPMDPEVDPAADPTFNHNYTIGDTSYGTNSVQLTTAQIPSHTHIATTVVTDPGHTHVINLGGFDANVDGPNGTQLETGIDTPQTTQSSITGISVGVTNSNTGGDNAHANTQPSIGAYFIMYIP